MIYAYLLAADGLKVLNRLLPFLRASLLSEGTLPEKEDCFALAGDLERWLPMCSAGMRICCVT